MKQRPKGDATEVWYRVQAALTAHQTSGEKTQAHDHYLRRKRPLGESIDDSLRCIANQAFFDKLIVLPEDGVVGEPGEPFKSFFNPKSRLAPSATRSERRNLDLKPPMSAV